MENISGERVRELREKLKLSQEALGARLGYTGRAAISKIETGVNGIPSDKINDFACELHTSSSYLLGETNISEDVWHVISLGNPVLTDSDKALIEKLHALSEEDQVKVRDLIEWLLEHHSIEADYAEDQEK